MPVPIKISVSGDNFRSTQSFLVKALKPNWQKKMIEYGRIGMMALAQATPKDTGKTSESWGFEIIQTQTSIKLIWTNDNIQKGWANIAILLQYGHATRNGGYVEGVDYINPAIRPVFERMAKEMWGEIISE